MSQPQAAADDPTYNWRQAKRRLKKVKQQIQVQADLINDTRLAFSDDNETPYKNCAQFVGRLEMLLQAAGIFSNLLDLAIGDLIEGDGVD